MSSHRSASVSKSKSKSKSRSKSKSLSLSKLEVKLAATSSLAKYSSSSKKAASAGAKFSTSSLKKFSTSSKAAATSSKKAASAAASKSAASAAAKAKSASSVAAVAALLKTTAVTTTTTTKSSTATTTTSSKTTTTSKSTTAAAAASSAATTTNKKGLGYNTASFTTAFGSSIGWVYNWGQDADGTLYPGVEYVPMLWGSGSESTWIAAATQAIEEGATALLAYNEPDYSAQANLTPARAASGWKTYMEPFYGKAKLISPAITNSAGKPGSSSLACDDPPAADHDLISTGIGSPWMDQFLGNCSSCHIDAIAMHWYDSATNTGYINAYFDDAATRWGKKIWVTEYAGSGTVAQQQTFLEYANAYFEDTAAIEKYGAFGDFAGTFVNSNGSLTALGTTYKNAI